jgi:DNA-binding response OmpR family regulator
MKGDEEKAFEAGCDGYITKPIDTRTFPDLIRKYLANAHPAQGDSAPAGRLCKRLYRDFTLFDSCPT